MNTHHSIKQIDSITTVRRQYPIRPVSKWSSMMMLLTLMCIACGTEGDDSSTPTPEQSDTGHAADKGPTSTSLSADVFPLIAQSCGGCHTRTNAPFPPAVENSVYYDEPADIYALVGSFIIAGHPNDSGFVAILTQDLAVGSGPTLMPPPGMAEPMSAQDINIVKSWITEGAQNN